MKYVTNPFTGNLIPVLDPTDVVSYQPRMHCRRVADLIIGADTLVDMPVIDTSYAIDLASGVFTVQEKGIYNVDFFLYIESLGNVDLSAWVEKSTDDGVTWENEGHLVMNELNDSSTSLPLAGLFQLEKNDKFRIKLGLTGSGSATAKSKTFTNSLGVITQYGLDFSMVKVSDFV